MTATQQEPESAVRLFMGCPELLMLVGDVLISDRDSIRTLCSVSKAFHAVYSPILHRTVTLIEKHHPSHTETGWLPCLARNWQTELSKTLRIFLYGPRIRTQCMNSTFRPSLPSVIKRMPNLKAIEVTGLTLDDTWLQHIGCLHRLEDLCLEFKCPLDFGSLERLPLTGATLLNLSAGWLFASLRSFVVKDAYFDEAVFTPTLLASILAAAPGLQSFSLAIDGEPCNTLLEAICIEYAATKMPALPLRWLSLGQCVHPPPEETLNILFDLAVLQKIYVADCPCQAFILQNASLPIWHLLQPSVTPLLQDIELSFATIRDWDFLPMAVQGRQSLKIADIRNDGAMQLMTLGDMARRACVPMLRIPIPAFSEVSLEETFRSLESCIWLTHLRLGLQTSLCSGSESGMTTCRVPILARTFSQLPALKAVSVIKQRLRRYTIDTCHGVKHITSTVELMVAESQSLEYIDLFDVAFLIQRDASDPASASRSAKVIKLSRRVKPDFEPEFFQDTWNNGFRNGVGAC